MNVTCPTCLHNYDVQGFCLNRHCPSRLLAETTDLDRRYKSYEVQVTDGKTGWTTHTPGEIGHAHIWDGMRFRYNCAIALAHLIMRWDVMPTPDHVRIVGLTEGDWNFAFEDHDTSYVMYTREFWETRERERQAAAAKERRCQELLRKHREAKC